MPADPDIEKLAREAIELLGDKNSRFQIHALQHHEAVARALLDALAENERLTADRDAWRAATGLANLTPIEAGRKIDEGDAEHYRLRTENERLRAALRDRDETWCRAATYTLDPPLIERLTVRFNEMRPDAALREPETEEKP